jgi:hypothetical protein
MRFLRGVSTRRRGTFAPLLPARAWGRHCRRARHVRASYFERRRRFGAPARRTNRSGAIKLPLKATALARQRPTHGPTSAGSPAVHLPEASERRAERGSRRAGAAPTKTTPRRLRVRRRLPRQPARRLRLRCVAIGGSFVLNCRVPCEHSMAVTLISESTSVSDTALYVAVGGIQDLVQSTCPHSHRPARHPRRPSLRETRKGSREDA